jgi:hypothetical protein
MKSPKLVTYLFFFATGGLFAQNDAVTFDYPLNAGNVWEYRWRSNGFATLYTYKATGDTLMPNAKVYRIIERYSPAFGTAYTYQRLDDDSTAVYQFYLRYDLQNELVADEFLLYKLAVSVGESWKFPTSAGSDSATFQVTQIADTSLWSQQFKFVHFFSPEAFELQFILVDGIGIVWEGFEGGYLELLGAAIGNKRFGTMTSVHSSENIPDEGELLWLNHYPNPFNGSTTIAYEINTSGRVRVSIFNLLGERVKVLGDSFEEAGFYEKIWPGTDESDKPVSSGTYIYAMELDGKRIAQGTLLFLK